MANNISENPDNESNRQENLNAYTNNPEGIIDDLKLKSKETLANKISGLFTELKNQNKDNREDKLKALREGLNQQDQIEIRNTLGNNGKGLDEVLSEPIVKTEIIKNTSENPEVKKEAKKFGFDSILGFFDKFSNASEIYEKVSKAKGDSFGGMLAGIGAFLAYLFKGKLPEIEGVDWTFKPKPQKKPEENKPGNSVENGSENIDIYGYNMKILTSYCKLEGNITNFALSDGFKSLKISEIEETRKNDTKINTWIQKNYPNENINKTDIKKLFTLFSTGDGIKTIQNLTGQNFDKNKTLSELLGNLKENNDLQLFDKFMNKDLFSLTDGDHSEFIKIDKNQNSKEVIQMGITPKISEKILTIQYKTLDNRNIILQNQGLNEEELKTMDKMLTFGDNLLNTIKNNKDLNLKTDMSNINLDLKEIAKMYILLGGESDFDKMNEFKQSYLYFSIPQLLGESGEKWKEGEYTGKLGIEIAKSLQNNSTLPEGVKRFLNNVGEKIINYSLATIKSLGIKVTGGALELITEYPWLVPAIISIVLVYPFAQRKTLLGVIIDAKKSK